MCLESTQTFTQCPCHKTITKPCFVHDEAEADNIRHYHRHRHIHGDPEERHNLHSLKKKLYRYYYPDQSPRKGHRYNYTVVDVTKKAELRIDSKTCVLWYKEAEKEVVDGDCRIGYGGKCPYVEEGKGGGYKERDAVWWFAPELA